MIRFADGERLDQILTVDLFLIIFVIHSSGTLPIDVTGEAISLDERFGSSILQLENLGSFAHTQTLFDD